MSRNAVSFLGEMPSSVLRIPTSTSPQGRDVAHHSLSYGEGNSADRTLSPIRPMSAAAKLRALLSNHVGPTRSKREGNDNELTTMSRLNDQKTALLYTASHEVRGSLHGIFGLVERLRDERTPPDTSPLLDALADACSGLRSTVQQVLDVAQLENRGIQPSVAVFDLRVLLREVGAVVSGVSGPAVAVRTSIDDECSVFRFGDSGRINQILTNIATNGAKAMEHGVLSIHAGEVADGVVRFIVRDEGEGMPQFARARLIAQSADGNVLRQDRRQRTGDRRSTVGLGLLIARELIESLNGRVDVSVERNAGTTVQVDLPLPARASSPQPIADPEAGLTIRRALIVDDAPEGLQFLAHSLDAICHSCDETLDSEEALALAQSEPYDLVILDGMMSPHDGADLSRALRLFETTRDSVIIVATGNVETVSSSRYLAAGADLVLVKPFSRIELVRAVRRTIALRSAGAAGLVIDLRPADSNDETTPTSQPADLFSAPLRLFDSLLPGRLEAIRDAFTRGDAGAFARAVHTLGSPAVVLGVDGLGRYCLALETIVSSVGMEGVGVGALDQLALLAATQRPEVSTTATS